MESKPAQLRGGRLIGLAAGLALAYAVAGWLGLQVAVPPGYATIIWPASGIAMAALLIFSPRLAPGIFLASLLVNLGVGQAMDLGGFSWPILAVALIIAGASTLQALAGAMAARRLFGVPTLLRSLRDVAVFGCLVGPLACTITTSAGTAALVAAGLLPPAAVPGHWLIWWLGDLLGIAVVLPLALLGPWRRWGAGWSRQNAAGLQPASVIALMIPLLLTFQGWRWTGEIAYERGAAAFATLSGDSEQALGYRLASYSRALDGAAGLFHASTEVTAADWKNYVDELDIGVTLPGIAGMGFIDDVPDAALPSYGARVQALGVDGLVVHPVGTPGGHHFITRFIEPLAANRSALGLDNAFEAHRREAAEMARASGDSIITKRIFLVQDSVSRAGFLLLKPLYVPGQPMDTVAQRLAAFEGWVFAPFIGARFMEDLTSSQSQSLQIHVYDGAGVDPDRLIYASVPDIDVNGPPTYAISKTMSVMGQTWTIVWSSTQQFDGATKSNESLFVLLSGLLLWALFAGFLLSYARREETIRDQVVQKTREIGAREQENRAVVDTAVVGIMLLDGRGQVLSANEAALGIFNVQARDVVRMSIPDLLQIESHVSIAEDLGGFLSARPVRLQPAVGLSLDGKRLSLELQLNPWMTELGQQRYTALVRDVTLQRQTTAALEDAEERWSSALRGAGIGVYDIDLVTGKSIVSDTWWEMLGYARTETVDPQIIWRQRVHPDDLPQVDANDEACISGATARSEGEYRIEHRNGGWIWMRYDASVTRRNEQGRGVRLVGTQTDITALRAAEQDLRSSEERLRTAVSNAPIGMALIDPKGNWIDFNQALLTFLGYTSEAFRALAFRDLSHPDDAELDAELIPRLVAGEISNYQLERRYLHGAGHVTWGLLSVSAARAPDGSIDYFIAQVQDIGHRKEMDRIKSEFISNVSHELRTPLTSIRGALGLILGAMADEVPPSVMRLLTIAHKNSERLILLINDILDLEKMNSENLQFEIGAHRLHQEVVLAIDSNQGFATQFDVDYVLDTPDADMECNVDPARLQQVLSNLMSNAAKFSPLGGTVHLSIRTVGRMARVSISDKGVGVPASFRSRIFSAFSQADASATREAGGTGLGLHISKQMVEKMLGTLDYSSVEGSGSTFWIDLPLTEARSKAAARRRFGSAGSPVPHLLHVEDDASFREFIAGALQGRLDISHAATLDEARRMLEDQEFDLVLLDLHLPDGNGTDLLDELERYGRRPIVVLTGDEAAVTDKRVSASVVKSGMSEDSIVDLILGVAALPKAEARQAR